MVACRSEMSAEWKVRFAIYIASVAIHAFTKLLFSFSDVLKATNCTFQEVDNIFCLAVGIAVYDEFFSCMFATEFMCALDGFARHTSSRITSSTLTIIGRSGGSLKILHSFWCFCIVVQCSRTMLDTLLSVEWYMMTNGTLLLCSFLYIG